MAEGKKAFVLYTSQLAMVEKLSDEQAGQLYKHILKYVNDLNPSEPNDLVVSIAFESIKPQLKSDLKKWEDKCKQNQANIRKRWERAKEIQTNTTVYESNNSYSDNDKEEDKEEDKDVSIKENDKPKRKVFIKPTIEEIESYCKEKGINLDAEYFWNFYESKGWKIGNTKMSNWHSAIATWVKKQKDNLPRKSDTSSMGEDKLGKII